MRSIPSRPLLVLLTGILTGCATLPAEVPISNMPGHAAARPACCCDNVHIFVLESPFDIWHLAGMPKFADSLREMGFNNVYFHDLLKDGNDDVIADRIREIKAAHPSSRILLIGYSTATLMVEDAIGRVNADGIWIDSAIYIDSYWYRKIRTGPRPQNCLNSILIYRENKVVPTGHPNESTHIIAETNHLNSPLNLHSYEVMVGEAIRLTESGCPCGCHHEPVPTVALPELESAGPLAEIVDAAVAIE